MDERLFEKIVSEIVETLSGGTRPDAASACKKENNICRGSETAEMDFETAESENEAEVFVTDGDKFKSEILKTPSDLGALIRMKSRTPARIGVGKAGARLKTKTMLALRADHAAARDSVFADVDKAVLEALGLKSFQTEVRDKNEYLTRPDLGKKFSEEELRGIAAEAGENADVLIYASDGLSSEAVNANIQNILPVIQEGLKLKNFKVAKPFYVKFGRVGAEDAIAEATKAAVVCVLLGERPGLATAESMSAYIAYKPYVGMPEARRTVVSNIHKGGTMAIEAGAYICDIIEQIYNAKASGVELKKQGDAI